MLPAPADPARTPWLPIGAVILGLALFSVMDGVMKAASIISGAYAAMFWRSLAGSTIMLPLWLIRARGRPDRATMPDRKTMKVHLLRGVVASTMAVTFFYGLVRTPLAEGIALSFIAPLIALYLSVGMLGETLQKSAVTGSVAALCGVGVICWGKFEGAPDPEGLKGLLAIFVSAVLYAWNLVLQRRQALLAPPEEVAFFQTAVSFGFLGLGAWWFAPWPSAESWALIVVSAVLATASLMLLSWAYARAEAQILVPLEYSAFVWAAIVGWIAFGEDVTLATLAGVVFIVAGCLYATRRNPDPPRPEMPN